MNDLPEGAVLRIPIRDRVTSFTTDSDRFLVSFAVSAAIYEVDAANPDFPRIVASLADGWGSGRDVDVVVEGTTIVDIRVADGG